MIAKTAKGELRKIKEFAQECWEYVNGVSKNAPTGNATFVKEDGKLSLVPAWYLFDSNSGEDRQIYYRHANMSINALDGTVLYAY